MKENRKNIYLSIIVILSMFIAPSYIYMAFPFIKNVVFRTLLANIIYLLLLIFIFRKEVIKGFKSIKKDYKKIFNVGLKYWALGIFLMIISNFIINYLVFGGDIATNEEMVRETILDYPLFGIISAVIVAPFTEELIFRGSLRRCFKNKYFYAITSGVIFGLMHAISGYSSPLDLLYIIPYGSLGYAFSMMYYETDNIYTNIFMHSLHNLLSCVLIFMVLG